MENFASYISIDNNIRFGKPCIKGTRIAISYVLQWFASGISENEILAEYDYLTKEQIRAALAFAEN